MDTITAIEARLARLRRAGYPTDGSRAIISFAMRRDLLSALNTATVPGTATGALVTEVGALRTAYGTVHLAVHDTQAKLWPKVTAAGCW